MPDSPKGYRWLEQSERHRANGARKLGSAKADETLSVSIRIRRNPAAPALPTLTDTAVKPSAERKILSREEFASTYGATRDDLDKVIAFAKNQGLKIEEESSARRTVRVSGTVAQMQKAFAVELGHYETATETYRGREGQIGIPENLAEIVEGVFGLDNRRMAKPLIAQANGSPSQTTSPLTPPKVATLYDFPTPMTASGETIGLLEFGGGYLATDITTYFKNLGLKAPTLTAVGVDGATNAPGTSGSDEVTLDIDVAGSVAQDANLAVYFAPWTEQGWVDIVTSAVHDTKNNPSVLSISWGWPEFETFGALTWSNAAMNAVDSTFQEAFALGVTVFAASGDSGSSCGMTDGKAHCLFPASDPWVSACGGTTISNVSGANFTQNTWTPTGGGISDYFAMPYWQNWAGLPKSVNDGQIRRGIPDIAGNADPASGYPLVLNGVTTSPYGGTSAVAPLYAALTAILNSNLGEPLGYINPNLYAFTGPYVYVDVNDGLSNASGGAAGYKSGPGWDACTGFGSIVGTAMLTALEGVGLEPALAVYNSKLFMAWKGMERDDRIFYTTYNGTAWAPQQQVPGVATSSGVSLAVYNNKLYMAWKGMEADQGIYWSEFNGTGWAPQQQVSGVGTSTGPAIAEFNNALYMTWKGLEGDQRIFWSSFNGTTWTAQQVIPNVGTSVGPSLAVFQGSLVMGWKGIYGDQRIFTSHFNGTTWTAQQQVAGVGSSEGPTLAVYNNLLYAAWKGEFADQRIFWSSFNGASWAPQQQVPGVATSVGPGLATFNNHLYAAWKGQSGDQRIWTSNFNGTAWTPQQQIAGVGTSPDLISVK